MTEDTFHETVAPLPHSCSLVTNCTARRRMIVGRILTLSSFARVQRSEMLLESSTPPELHSTAPTGSVLWVWPRQTTPEQTEAQWPPNLPCREPEVRTTLRNPSMRTSGSKAAPQG